MPTIGVSLLESTVRRYDVLPSVFSYAASAPDWIVVPMPVAEEAWLSQVGHAQLDGMITSLEDASGEVLAACRRLSIPVVDLSNRPSPFSTVSVDPESVADLAYGQLSPVHRETVLFATSSKIAFSQYSDLEIALQQQCLRGGSRFDRVELELSPSELMSLSPKPSPQIQSLLNKYPGCGIIASCDLLAVYMLRVARRLGIEVPGKMAIVSARDSLTCGLPSVSVTSVIEPTRELGLQAESLLHQLFRCRATSPIHLSVRANEAVQRATTSDSKYELSIARALHFIDQNVLRDISVPKLLQFQSISRVTFERRFRDAVGCPPGEYIRREKVKRIKEYLLTTSKPISQIAHECGFQSVMKFSTFFKNIEGLSPKQFRGANCHAQVPSGE